MQSQWNPPYRRIFLRLDITGQQETLLANANLARLFGDGNNRETDLANPEVHEAADILS